jgi:hypothetical protein
MSGHVTDTIKIGGRDIAKIGLSLFQQSMAYDCATRNSFYIRLSSLCMQEWCVAELEWFLVSHVSCTPQLVHLSES